MKIKYFLGWSSALFLSVLIAQAQETTDKLQQQLKEMQERFEKQQRDMRETFERMMREQQSQIDALKQQIASATNAPGTNAIAGAPSAPATNAIVGTPSAPPPGTASAQDVEDLKQRVDELTTASKRTSVNQFNPGIGFVGDTIFSYTSKGQQATGSDRPGGYDVFMRAAELNLEASVDPFARAYGVISASADPITGEANLGVEEASIVTTSLPWNLTVQGGRFFADFGRLSYVHDHDLPFVFRPLVLDRYIGGESRTDGAQVNYLFPTTQYLSLTMGLGNGFGADLGPGLTDGYRSINGLNYWGHLSTYFDLTPNLSLETGVSGLIDDKAEGFVTMPTQRNRYIGGADITLRYQPLTSTVYKGLVWGTEVLHNSANFDDTTGEHSENSFGLYSYVETKLSREIKAGFLFDFLQEPNNDSAEIFRYSPYITWNPSEFQLLRLQYSHTSPNADSLLKASDAVYLQWSFIIGRHVHGFKQR